MSEPIFRALCGVISLAGAIIVAACSSSTTAGVNCSNFSACGGNVVGTWKMSSACVSGGTNPLASQCPASTFQLSETVSGTVTFNGDGTYSSNVTSSASESVTIPSSCINGATCDQLQTAFNQTDAGAGAQMATCSTAAGGCSCQVSITEQPGPTTGTYTVSGSNITLNGQPGTYCVQGNDLLLQQSIGAMGMAGSGTATFAAVKQ